MSDDPSDKNKKIIGETYGSYDFYVMPQAIQTRIELVTYLLSPGRSDKYVLPRWIVRHSFFMLMHDEVSMNKLTDFSKCLCH